MEVNFALLFYLVEGMATDIFKKKLSVLEIEVRHFLKWVIEVDISAAKSIKEIMKIK